MPMLKHTGASAYLGSPGSCCFVKLCFFFSFPPLFSLSLAHVFLVSVYFSFLYSLFYIFVIHSLYFSISFSMHCFPLSFLTFSSAFQHTAIPYDTRRCYNLLACREGRMDIGRSPLDSGVADLKLTSWRNVFNTEFFAGVHHGSADVFPAQIWRKIYAMAMIEFHLLESHLHSVPLNDSATERSNRELFNYTVGGTRELGVLHYH